VSRPGRPAEALAGGRRPTQDPTTNLILALGAILIATFGAFAGLGLISQEPKAAPVLLAAGVLAVFMIYRPAWIVPAFIALTWMALPGRFFGGLPSPVEMGGLVLVSFAAWRSLRRPELAAEVLVIVTLLAAPLIISGALSSDGPTVPVKDLRELLFLFIAALCVYGVGSAERAATALVVVGLILGLGGIYSVLVGPSELFPLIEEPTYFTEREAARAAGPFGEPNFYALSMAALTPLALYLITKVGWRRWLGIGALIAIAGGIMAAGSRGAAVAMLFGIGAVALFTANRQLRLAVLAIALAAVAIVPLLFASQLGSSATRSVSGRATENLIAVEMLGDRPITGVGPDQYVELYRDYSRDIGDDPRPTREPHSLPLEIAAEQGVVGIVGWLAAGFVALSYVLSRGIWSTVLGRALVISVAAYMVGSLFLHGSQLRLPFILVGLALAYATDLAETASRGRRAEAG
jgi:O-antigen ligase